MSERYIGRHGRYACEGCNQYLAVYVVTFVESPEPLVALACRRCTITAQKNAGAEWRKL